MNNFPEVNEQVVALWGALCRERKCFMCKKKFPDGIIIPMPRDTTTPFIQRVDAEFLFHLQSTHGIFPEMFDMIFRDTIKKRSR